MLRRNILQNLHFKSFFPCFLSLSCISPENYKITENISFSSVSETFAGHRRSDVDEVKKISTSIFVTNFPDQLYAKDLWKVRNQYENVVDTFIPNRYPNQRSPLKNSNTQFINKAEKKSASCVVHKDGGVYGYSNSYAHVVKIRPQPQNMKEENKQEIVLDETCMNQQDYSTSLIGGYWVMIEFRTEASKEKFKVNVGIGSWFSQLEQTSNLFHINKRVTWVDIEGIPLKVWTKNTFNQIASKWEIYYMSKIRMKVTLTVKDSVSKRNDEEESDTDDEIRDEGLHNESASTHNHATVEGESDVEEVSETIFEKEQYQAHKKDDLNVGQNDIRSEDPFNIYDLLNKKQYNIIGDEQFSGSTTIHSDALLPSSSPVKTSDNLLEEFADEFTLPNPFPPGNDDSILKKDVHEENFQIYSNSLFEFEDNFNSINENPFFNEMEEDVENENSKVFDEPVLPHTPFSDKVECFNPGGDNDEIDAFLAIEVPIHIEGYFDSEGDVTYLESLLSDDTTHNFYPEVFFDHESQQLRNEPENEPLITFSPKSDPLHHEFTGELITIPPGIVREHEDYINRMSLLCSNSSSQSPENSHTIIESLPTSTTLVEDSDPNREEIDIFSGQDDSIPPGVESDFDSEEDIIDNLLNNDSTHERLTFNIEPDAPVINNVDEDECFDPRGGKINVEVDNSFTYVTWIFLPYLTYPEVDSSKNIKKTLKAELAEINLLLDKGKGNSDVLNKRMSISKSLKELDKLESMEVAQKAKIKWAIEGDENSKYYHGILNKKRSQLTIRGISVDGIWIDSPCLVKSEFFSHFINRFDQPQDCEADKSSGPMGSHLDFIFGIGVFWKKIRRRLYTVFFQYGTFLKGGNSSFITLVLKMHDAKMVKDFRPITLIESLYKIIAKILENRLMVVLGDIVNKVQSAFVANRQILDGPFILNKLFHWCKKNKKQTMIFKVDFEKAYDLVRWDYLDDVLKKFGFGDTWWQINAFNVGLRFDAHLSFVVIQSSHEGSLENGIYSLSYLIVFTIMVWRLRTQGSPLWARVIIGIHGEDGKLGKNINHSHPFIWLDIVREMDQLKNHEYMPWRHARMLMSQLKCLMKMWDILDSII
ncbi:RNA-directed DNA polymerase, eukaryota, reverse transcriptase zinc-binding domain protein [Tanacetum coccineum]